jgi:hypothetical protein
VLNVGPLSNRCEVVLGHRGGARFAVPRIIRSRLLPPSRLAQRTRAKALLKLFLIHTDGAGNPDYTVSWNLALPDPEINRIGRNPESVGDFTYLCKSGHHHTTPCFHQNTTSLSDPDSRVRFGSRWFASVRSIFRREVFEEGFYDDAPIWALVLLHIRSTAVSFFLGLRA